MMASVLSVIFSRTGDSKALVLASDLVFPTPTFLVPSAPPQALEHSANLDATRRFLQAACSALSSCPPVCSPSESKRFPTRSPSKRPSRGS